MNTITFPGNLDSLGAIAKYVMNTAKDAGLDKKAIYNLRLAIDEVATNIIIHGYEEANLEGEIILSSEITSNELKIIIEDIGAAYNPYETEKVEEETLNLPMEEKPMGGLGIFLAIESVDEFIYERKDEKNHNIFIMKRHQLTINN